MQLQLSEGVCIVQEKSSFMLVCLLGKNCNQRGEIPLLSTEYFGGAATHMPRLLALCCSGLLQLPGSGALGTVEARDVAVPCHACLWLCARNGLAPDLALWPFAPLYCVCVCV
eukprot:scpid112611/ scgid22402/ 